MKKPIPANETGDTMDDLGHIDKLHDGALHPSAPATQAPHRSFLRYLLGCVPQWILSRFGVAATVPEKQNTLLNLKKEGTIPPKALLCDTGTIPRDGNACCAVYHQGEPLRVPQCRYPILFVLQGALELHFGPVQQQLDARQMCVIDTQALTSSRCAESTIILEFIPSERLSFFLGHCSVAFREPCSDVIPILPPLEAWIDTLLNEYLRVEEWTPEFRHARCKELTAILLRYPRGVLEKLHAAFSVCAQGGCERCMNKDMGIHAIKPSQQLENQPVTPD